MSTGVSEVPWSWRIGDVVAGLYEVAAVHGDGGMGVVYKVRHRVWDVDLAVKSPRPERFRGAVDRERFVAEAEAWVSLGLHPHVCACHYVRTLGGVPRIFAEYVEGGSLREWIDDRRLYAGGRQEIQARILDVAIQIAWGLEHAHSRGLVHQDVKPANVLLDGAGTAKVTDFGLARARSVTAAPDSSPADSPGLSVLVSSGGLTPAYASPEQAGGRPLGRRSDLYSFAVSVLEMFNGGVSCMTGAVAGEALGLYRAEGPTDAGLPAMPPYLHTLLARCLEEEPGRRPASMAEVAAQLANIYRRVTGLAYPRPAPAAADLRADELGNRALSLLDLGREAEADAAFAAALEADPRHLETIYNAGGRRWRRGAVSDEDLVAEIETIRADTGDSRQARHLLAQVHMERGDLTSARELLDRVPAQERPEVRATLRTLDSGEIGDARCTGTREIPWHQNPPPRTKLPIRLSPDGTRALTGEADGTLRLWDLSTGACLLTLNGHEGPVRSVDLSGMLAVSAGEDDTVRLWDLAEGRCMRVIPARAGEAGFGLGGRVAVYSDWNARSHVWDIREERIRGTLKAQGSYGLRSARVSPDGRWALIADTGGQSTVRVWDLEDCTLRHVLTGHGPGLADPIGFSPDGRHAAIATFGGPIRLWNLSEGRCVRTLEAARGGGFASLSADGRHMLTGLGGFLRFWDWETGRCVRTFRVPQGRLRAVRLSPDARSALSIGDDNTVRGWDLPHGYRAAPTLSRPRRHTELSLLGARVDTMVAEAEQAVRDHRLPAALDLLRQARETPGHERAPEVLSAWRALGSRSVRTGLRAAWQWPDLTGHTRGVNAIDLTGDGRTAVSGGADGTIRLWDIEVGVCTGVLKGHTSAVHSACLSPDGRRLLSGDWSGVVRLWRLDTGECLRTFPGTHALPDLVEPEPATSGCVVDEPLMGAAHVGFSADGRMAVVGGADGGVRLWDLGTGRHLSTLRDEAGPPARGGSQGVGVTAVWIGPDGRLAASADRGMIRLWDLGSGRCLHSLRAPASAGPFPESVTALSLSADGRFALSSGLASWPLRLWDTTTGKCVREFDALGGWATQARFTVDGRFAVSAHMGTVGIWHIGSAQCVRTLEFSGKGHLQSLALSRDSRFVLTGDGEGTIRRWELDWELGARELADWDPGAAPYLETFLRRHGGQWTAGDEEDLLQLLQHAGYGWLRPEGIRSRLDRMTA
ncbi:protein kinase domain-containing protein [Streptomyces sp. Qhu_M48]|uniref:WD40 repeat domain-containing serine/threonine protein kinase n=1 Tax=Streptomyces sp. Qhu_M48 TaxID=3435889 RepID=UPI003F50813A